MNWKKLIPLIPAALVLGPLMIPWGCANTTTPPSGGPKDTIPPVLVKVAPLPGSVNVPAHRTKLVFTFNEYVKVKDANAVYLSPPLEKKPKTAIRGKSLEVTFESDLDTNTTYTLDLTGAIADNNEGNLYPGFTLVFSTGPQIDSMCVTGLVQDCNTLMPVKGATVMLYKDQSDSAIFLHRPVAAARTDDWGFFSIRNIQDTIYRVYAIKDENNNNLYDPDNERVAFLDSLFRPSIVYNDSLYEFKKFDMKDTTLCLARKTQLELNLFRECYAHGGRHNYISNGTSGTSGNVFLRCISDSALNVNEGHRGWTQGMLYDCHQEQNMVRPFTLGLYNRVAMGTGHGWAAVQSVLWNCDVDANYGTIGLQKPPTAQNYAIGCKAKKITGKPVNASDFTLGYVEGQNKSGLQPESLYEAQLSSRHAATATNDIYTEDVWSLIPKENIRLYTIDGRLLTNLSPTNGIIIVQGVYNGKIYTKKTRWRN